jgi:hypothetical protein
MLSRPPTVSETPRVYVLVANEPRGKPEALSGALTALRPDASVVAVEPAELHGMVVRTRPDLVFCSSLAPAVEAGSGCRRCFTRTARRGSRRASNLERAVVADLRLAAALALVDRAVALAEG